MAANREPMDTYIKIRMKQSQKDQIEADAEELDITVSDLARSRLFPKSKTRRKTK